MACGDLPAAVAGKLAGERIAEQGVAALGLQPAQMRDPEGSVGDVFDGCAHGPRILTSRGRVKQRTAIAD